MLKTKTFKFIFGKEIIMFTPVSWVWFTIACTLAFFLDVPIIANNIMQFFIVYILGFFVLEYLCVLIKRQNAGDLV